MDLDKRRVGSWIRVRFWDHCIESARPKHKSKPILCEVSGLLKHAGGQHIVVTSWHCNHPDEDTADANVEEYVIVRSTITEWGFANVEKWYPQ